MSVPTPNEADPDGERYAFEKGAKKLGGEDGFADVWKRGFFAWEYKGKKKDLAAAYEQLNRYREDLENPPILVVCDMDRFEVHTNHEVVLAIQARVPIATLATMIHAFPSTSRAFGGLFAEAAQQLGAGPQRSVRSA
jgi:hypothetical protein